MRKRRILVWTAIAASLAVAVMLTAPRGASTPSQRSTGGTQSGAAEPVPAFNAEAPHGPLLATLSPSLFENIVVQNAYAVAARIRKVLYQQPCYCYCDRSQGHGSLLDCFASRHGSGCDVCVRENLYAYEQTRKGKSPAQIRGGIENGEWRQVDLSKYEKPIATKQRSAH